MADTEPEQITIMRQLIELSAERSYMNAERTLSVWVRTALGLIICGLAVDRFGLFVVELPVGSGQPSYHSNAVSNWVGVALVAAGVVVALMTGLRFYAYAAAYLREHRPPYYHTPILGPFFATMVGVFGLVVLIVMVVIAW